MLVGIASVTYHVHTTEAPTHPRHLPFNRPSETIPRAVLIGPTMTGSSVIDPASKCWVICPPSRTVLLPSRPSTQTIYLVHLTRQATEQRARFPIISIIITTSHGRSASNNSPSYQLRRPSLSKNLSRCYQTCDHLHSRLERYCFRVTSSSMFVSPSLLSSALQLAANIVPRRDNALQGDIRRKIKHLGSFFLMTSRGTNYAENILPI